MTKPEPQMNLEPINRRRFLARFGLGATAPLVVAPSVLGRDGSVAPSNRVMVGALGVNNRWREILPGFIATKGLQMRAVCDCRADRLKPAQELLNRLYGNTDCQTHADFRELLARDDLDAVYIATGNRWHGLASIYAAKAGKDVYSEKPISLTVAEGRALVDVCRRLGTVYQAGHQRRSVDSYKFMAEVVRRGLIGRVRTVDMQVWEGAAIKPQPPSPAPPGFDYEMWLGQAPWKPFNWAHVNAWQYFWDTAEGMLSDMGCHYTDLMQFALDTDHTGPVEFEGTAVWPDPKTSISDTPVRAEVRARYASGVTCLLHQRGGFTERYLRILGEEGWIQVDDQTDVVTAEPKSILGLRRDLGNKGWGDASDHIGNWLQGIRTRTQTVCHPESAHRAMSICQIMNICLRLGRNLSWDPAREQFVNDADANRMLARTPRPPWHL